MKLKKIISIIIVLTLVPFTLTGCQDAKGIENLAYVTAIGFDVGENNLIKVTFQFAKLTSSEQSGSSQPQNSEIVTIDCSSFDSGLNIINSYISKKVNLSHCKIIVFSEEIAVTGILEHVSVLASDREIRPDCNVLVSKCKAKDFLENSIPTLTNLTPRYYEILLNSKEYTGFSENVPLWKFFINMRNSTEEAVAILCGLNTSYTGPSEETSNLMDKDVNYKAGETPLTGKTVSQNMGLAVFSHDQLVGELDAIECVSYLMLTNNLDSCNISVPNPFENNSTINVKLELKKKTKNNVELVNGSPFIESNIYLNGSITSISLNTDDSRTETLSTIEEYVESYVSYNIKSLLYKTAKDFKADIVGFGKDVVSDYLTIEEWKSLNWAALYKNSFFKVDVEVTINPSSLFIKD